MADELPPMAFDQDPAAFALLPAMGDPNGAGMRWLGPMAVDPNVAVAVPAVIAIDPHPVTMRWAIVSLDDGRGRRYANDNLSHHGCGRHAKSKQRRQNNFLHGICVLHVLRDIGIMRLSRTTVGMNSCMCE